jgi:hypothetical protein
MMTKRAAAIEKPAALLYNITADKLPGERPPFWKNETGDYYG